MTRTPNTIGNIRVTVNKPNVVLLFAGHHVGIMNSKGTDGHVVRYPKRKGD